MKTQLITQTFGYRHVESKSLDRQIEVAIENHKRDPDEIHFSTAQTTASGGQFGHYAALLIWRSE